MQAYIIQRSLKDQIFPLCAAANGIASFDSLFGWEDLAGEPWSDEKYGKIIKNRMKIEDKIVRHIIGQDSGLSEGAQAELLRWNRMFNWEAHRGLFTMFRASQRIAVDNKFSMVLGPSSDELNEAMYMNRCTEIGWMILRLLPFMRRAETPKDEVWDRKWKLLDDSFKMMVDGLGGLGKKIAPAFTELIGVRFNFDPSVYYFEKK